MFNFNHERLYITTCALRLSRIVLDVCIRWAINRQAFGRSLSEIQVIRMKVASCARSVELLQHYLEFLVFQLNEMPFFVRLEESFFQPFFFNCWVFFVCRRAK